MCERDEQRRDSMRQSAIILQAPVRAFPGLAVQDGVAIILEGDRRSWNLLRCLPGLLCGQRLRLLPDRAIRAQIGIVGRAIMRGPADEDGVAPTRPFDLTEGAPVKGRIPRTGHLACIDGRVLAPYGRLPEKPQKRMRGGARD
jgi:hypothetical protein